ncbi:hypothetical protein TanjilG_32453 [Lupinus angustifolius]|uniref:Rapid ALkalinization Factor n=1 Tax=Lupinus angustifolius TaxID=3871 RepID=A0A1J7IBW0_LUPAN|nr:hypothetical protein TanjilG_32453 [Lupinus angustifolius]
MKKIFFLLLLIILIHLHLTKAIPMKINNNNKGCGEECMINMDEEFSLSSHAGARMLNDLSTSIVGKSGNSNGASINCPQSTGYRSCTPSKNGGPTQQCGTYTRTC